jgi:hypothetical protein
MSGTKTPTATELHGTAMTALMAAIEAVKAFLAHPDVTDDTTLHAAAKQVDYDLSGALATLGSYNVTQGVVPPEPEPEPEPVPEHEPVVKAQPAAPTPPPVPVE